MLTNKKEAWRSESERKDNEIIELTDEELDEIFADDDFDTGEEDDEIRSFYFSNPDPYAKVKPRPDDAPNIEQFVQRVKRNSTLTELTSYALRELVKAVYVDAPDKSSGKRRQKVHIEYDLVGYIPVDELLKTEQAWPRSCLFQELWVLLSYQQRASPPRMQSLRCPGRLFRIAQGIGVCRKQFHAENFLSKNSVDKVALLCYCINTLIQ